jgi:hypothetical protein
VAAIPGAGPIMAETLVDVLFVEWSFTRPLREIAAHWRRYATTHAEHPMKVFDIPYTPDAADAWAIPIPGDGERHFDQRTDALDFARTLTRKLDAHGDGPSFICVEGADGRWRLFDSDFKPVA